MYANRSHLGTAASLPRQHSTVCHHRQLITQASFTGSILPQPDTKAVIPCWDFSFIENRASIIPNNYQPVSRCAKSPPKLSIDVDPTFIIGTIWSILTNALSSKPQQWPSMTSVLPRKCIMPTSTRPEHFLEEEQDLEKWLECTKFNISQSAWAAAKSHLNCVQFHRSVDISPS